MADVDPGQSLREGSNEVLDRNIRELLRRRREEDEGAGLEVKVADWMTGFIGSMRFVYLHLAIVSWWIAVNLGWLPGPRFDPSFVVLAMAASVEAIFLSTFVLISQNRMAAVAEKRADLDLHISLLAEHEVTRLLQITQAIAQQLGVKLDRDGDLPELQKDVSPGAVLERLAEESDNVP